MIPQSLTLTNFTSYGANTPTLDLSQFRLACLSGSNGAGKSSVLDAMTYAIWGEARGKSPDDLVHAGALTMEVEIIFVLEGNTYKIIRSRNVKKGSTELSLLSKKSTGNEWMNLSEGTIKDTQMKIDQALKTSYETFTNSAFLRQGRADEFTLKGPTDRKKILSEILGLQMYDELEEKAKDISKTKGQEVSYLETQISEIDNELGQAEIRKDQMKQAEDKVLQLEEKLQSIEETVTALTQNKEQLLVIQSSRDQISKSIARLKREINEDIIQKERKEKLIATLSETLSKKDEIEKQYAIKQSLQKENELLSEKQTQLMQLLAQKNLEESRIQKEKNEQDKALAQLTGQCEALRKEGAKIKADKEKTENDSQKCPLCGNILNEEHKKQVIEKLDTELADMRIHYAEIDAKIKTIQARTIQSELLEKVEAAIGTLEYDEKKHRDLKTALMAMGNVEQRRSELAGAQAALDVESENIKLIQMNLTSKQKTLAEDEASLSGMQDVSASLAQVQQNLAAEETQKRILQNEERGARAILGEAKGLVSRSEQLGTLKEEKIVLRDKLTREKAAYEELALAFGKKGIQAMLIETAVPEIEEETNRLLDKLTDGRMRVTLATQKDTKKGDTVETLDILLSDELGSRPYEMYSGGETFRVNFALRLALSRLLTHRAGTKLQFLVIDEGFGTQDAQGREKLVDVINLIKDDFEKILVVTHIEELKELFPVRIEIEKKADGSTFHLVGV